MRGPLPFPPLASTLRPPAPLVNHTPPKAHPDSPLRTAAERDDGWMGTPREVVERLVATINDHDTTAGRALYAPDARAVSAAGRHLDLDGLDAILHTTVSAFPDFRVQVVRWVLEGDLVVTEEVMEGTHRGPFAGLEPTGRTIRLPMLHVTRVCDGQIVERIAYHDTAGILRQLTDEGRRSLT
jgi:steroid delta-isomerase-like uncharacterized protein